MMKYFGLAMTLYKILLKKSSTSALIVARLCNFKKGIKLYNFVNSIVSINSGWVLEIFRIILISWVICASLHLHYYDVI